MHAIDLLKHQSDLAYRDLQTALKDVPEGLAWARLPQGGADYLNTDASIFGITLHIAVCKRMFGSVGFKESEVRWHECGDQVAKFEPNWAAALEYLQESQTYWLSTWADLIGEDLDEERPHFSGCLWPAWKLIRMVIHHDAYHAGQIAMLRYACGESSTPPTSVAEDIRTHCRDLPDW